MGVHNRYDSAMREECGLTESVCACRACILYVGSLGTVYKYLWRVSRGLGCKCVVVSTVPYQLSGQ